MLSLHKIKWARISACNVITRLIVPNEVCRRDFSKITGDIELPLRPKKPATPFLRYLKEIKNSIQKEYPDATYQDIMQIASEKWRVCSPELKKPFLDSYKKDRESYFYERDSYEASLSVDQKAAIEELETEAAKKREKHKLKKGMNELGRPKAPPGPYALYIATKKGMKLPTETLSQWVNRNSAEWKNLPEIEKKPFFDQAKTLRLQFEKDFDLWKKEAVKVQSENPLVKNAQKKVMLLEERHKKKLLKQVSGKTHEE